MQIFLVLNGQSAGPFDEAQVRAMMAAGQAGPDTPCCPVGEQTWRPLGVALGTTPPGMPLATYAGQFQVAPPTNGLALTSLILGCTAPLLCCSTGIPAIICGHIALGQIKNANGAQGGRGLAVAGLVLGYVLTGFLALYILLTIGLGLAVPFLNNLKP